MAALAKASWLFVYCVLQIFILLVFVMSIASGITRVGVTRGGN